MNSQEINHVYISQSLKPKAQFDHVHVNSWATVADTVSDHDPAVAKLNMCER